MKVNYAIYLGTTSASITRMENGVPVIKKSEVLKHHIPLCIYFNKKGNALVGDRAYNALKRDKLKAMKGSFDSNAFIEFTRTLGTDKTYYSSNANKSFTSTELVAEILKTLRSFIKDEDVKSAVITVPSNYRINQIDAVREAGKLAGLHQIEIVQEPIAVSMAYGLDSIKYQGFSLVFSFKEDVFDTSLIKKGYIIDTKGDNHLGGKNLDEAIVDEIFIPYFKENYVIDTIIANTEKFQAFKEMWKPLAEDAKNQLSFKEEYDIWTNLYDEYGEDDEGEEFEIDVTITQSDIERALAPVFQKAIDVSQNLLKRNNLKGNSLDDLILVGGNTFSPVLRGMLEKQICKPNTSIDPKTVIVKGAVIYASTIDVSEEVRKQTRGTTKIQLEISNESSTVEMEEYVPIKILADKTDGEIPEKVFAEITRGDKAWSSGKVEINTTGDVVIIQLLEGKTNVFDVILYDNKGNRLECEPNSFSIKQGLKVGSTTLPYNIGIEIKQKTTSKIVFATIKGLEKNQSLPATGTINGIKTKKPIRPGMESDSIKIPIYQGEHNSDGTRAIYNEHVYDIIISGNDLPALLPVNSDVDLIVNIDKSQKITVTAFFPCLDYSTEIENEAKRTSLDINTVEDLLYELTADEKLVGSEFKNYLEQLSDIKENEEINTLNDIYKKLKEYE